MKYPEVKFKRSDLKVGEYIIIKSNSSMLHKGKERLLKITEFLNVPFDKVEGCGKTFDDKFSPSCGFLGEDVVRKATEFDLKENGINK